MLGGSVRNIRLASTFFALLFFCSTLSFAGPFGFNRGMTKDQVIQLVGKNAVKSRSSDGVTITVTTAPKPYDDFEEYILQFSPDEGLLKIIAVGRTIDTSSDGEQLKDSFDTLHKALVGAFGPAENDFDFLKSGSIWTEGHDFMPGLLHQDRTLASYWNPKNRADRIDEIRLKAVALDYTHGYIALGYEFEGWNEFVDTINAKKNSALQ